MGDPEHMTARDKLKTAGLVIGCLYGAVAVWVVIIGLPLGIFRGLTEHDWTLAVIAVVVAVIFVIGTRLRWIRSLND